MNFITCIGNDSSIMFIASFAPVIHIYVEFINEVKRKIKDIKYIVS